MRRGLLWCRRSSHKLAQVGNVPENPKCSCIETQPASGIRRPLVDPVLPSSRPARGDRPGTGEVVCTRTLPDRQNRNRTPPRAVSTSACRFRGWPPAWRVSMEARKLALSYPVEIRDSARRPVRLLRACIPPSPAPSSPILVHRAPALQTRPLELAARPRVHCRTRLRATRRRLATERRSLWHHYSWLTP